MYSTTPSGNIIEKDFRLILDNKEKENRCSKNNLQYCNSIKSVKEGYLSLAIPEIIKMMKEYNAITVLEDLSSSFKRSRQGIEKIFISCLKESLLKNLTIV